CLPSSLPFCRLSPTPPSPLPSLFPYTTLFRSRPAPRGPGPRIRADGRTRPRPSPLSRLRSETSSEPRVGEQPQGLSLHLGIEGVGDGDELVGSGALNELGHLRCRRVR